MNEITREELERAIAVIENQRIDFLERWDDFGGVNYAYLLALAALRAELSRQENAPLTWNERINQMTGREKAVFINRVARGNFCPKWIIQCRAIAFACEDCVDCLDAFLASPHTEGETT